MKMNIRSKLANHLTRVIILLLYKLKLPDARFTYLLVAMYTTFIIFVICLFLDPLFLLPSSPVDVKLRPHAPPWRWKSCADGHSLILVLKSRFTKICFIASAAGCATYSAVGVVYRRVSVSYLVMNLNADRLVNVTRR